MRKNSFVIDGVVYSVTVYPDGMVQIEARQGRDWFNVSAGYYDGVTVARSEGINWSAEFQAELTESIFEALQQSEFTPDLVAC